ncbi:MAG: transporter substrate-binding domain-containing protein [Planctomycetaceae bacterium]|nr:transporter substrate-binding domain-containing protein [Planctomycetaceae bacterium]
MRLILTFPLLAFVFVSSLTAAETPGTNPSTLRIGVYQNPPFVMRDGDRCSGMAMDLWGTVAGDMRIESSYQEYDSIRALLDAVSGGDIDVAVTNLAVDAERAERVSFTFPWFDSGLRILVLSRAYRSAWQNLIHNGHVQGYLLLFLLFIVVALVATFIRRRSDEGFPDAWADGFTTCLKEVISVAKSGEIPSHKPHWLRNLLVAAWMICGMAMLAYITSSVTSAMAQADQRHQGGIHELADLPGRNVGVLSGSGAEAYLGTLGVRVHPYNTLADAAKGLHSGEIAGLVADSAVLEYYAAIHPQELVVLTGQMFHPYKFSFAVAKANVALADRISVAIIGMQDSGALLNLRTRYFGRTTQDTGGGVTVAPPRIVSTILPNPTAP